MVDLRQQGIRASSAIAYSRILLEAAGRVGAPFEGPIMHDVLKALHLIDAEDEAAHAPDIDEETAWNVVLSLSGRERV